MRLNKTTFVFIILVLQLGLGITLFSQPAGSGWTLIFEDNFDSTQLDLGKWTPEYPWGREHNYNAFLSPGNVSVHDGFLWLKAEKKEQRGYAYTSGVISGHQKFENTFGYYEARIRMPAGKTTEKRGWWAAWWMASSDGWPPEIDICEYFKNGQAFKFNNIYRDKYGQVQYSVFDTPPFEDSVFHTYGMLWKQDSLQLFVDGLPVTGALHKRSLPKSPMFMILNFGLEKDDSWGDPDPHLPAWITCDYIRVWSRNSLPTAVPSPVKSLDVSAYHGYLKLAWDSAAGATSYQVYRRSSMEDSFSRIGERLLEYEYLDLATTPDTSYQYCIVASNQTGHSPAVSSEFFPAVTSPADAWFDDSNDSLLLFSSDFRSYPDPEAWRGTAQRSNWLKDGFVRFFFKGTSFELIGSRFPYCRDFDVEIDGQMLDSWKNIQTHAHTYERQTSLFVSPQLEHGTHRVKLYLKGNLFELDAVRVEGTPLNALKVVAGMPALPEIRIDLDYVVRERRLYLSTSVNGWLFSMQGRLLAVVREENELDLSAFSPGMYFLVNSVSEPLKICLTE